MGVLAPPCDLCWHVGNGLGTTGQWWKSWFSSRALQTPPLWGVWRKPCYCQVRVEVQATHRISPNILMVEKAADYQPAGIQISCMAFSDTILVGLLVCLITASQGWMSRFLTWPLLIWVRVGAIFFFLCGIWLDYHLNVLLDCLFPGHLLRERKFLLGLLYLYLLMFPSCPLIHLWVWDMRPRNSSECCFSGSEMHSWSPFFLLVRIFLCLFYKWCPEFYTIFSGRNREK